MFTFKVKDKEYKIKFSINAMAENDLMDRVQILFQGMDTNSAGVVKDFASCIRELLYVGSQKYNPIGSLEEAGDLLDDYIDEHKEKGEKDIVSTFFVSILTDLQDEGFLGDLLETMTSNQKGNQKVEK